MKRIATDRRHSPVGFTMLELLIVIGVISLLAGISFAVIGSMMAAAREKATRATITKIDGLLREQIGAFYKQLDPRNQETQALAGKFRSFPYDLTSDRETSLVLATKAAFLRLYPQNIYEVYGFDRQYNTADDIQLFSNWAKPPAMGGNIVSEADSSELLYLAMTEGKVVGFAPVSRSEFTASELGDTDPDPQDLNGDGKTVGDGHLEFVDAWGNPLRFYRWPTRLVNPLGFVANILRQDMTATSMTIPLENVGAFQDIPPIQPMHVVVGNEIIQVSGASGNDLVIVPGGRGALNTDADDHARGSIVKLAPFTNVATLLLGFVNSDVLAKDPDDKFGSIVELNQAGNLANIGPLGNPPFSDNAVIDYELLFHTLDSYHAPLIVSAGEDGELGLLEPGPVKMDTANPIFPDEMETRNPMNMWVSGQDLNNDGSVRDSVFGPSGSVSRWGTLAQPYTFDAAGNEDLTILTNPGGSVLADNITNYNGSN